MWRCPWNKLRKLGEKIGELTTGRDSWHCCCHGCICWPAGVSSIYLGLDWRGWLDFRRYCWLPKRRQPLSWQSGLQFAFTCSLQLDRSVYRASGFLRRVGRDANNMKNKGSRLEVVLMHGSRFLSRRNFPIWPSINFSMGMSLLLLSIVSVLLFCWTNYIRSRGVASFWLFHPSARFPDIETNFFTVMVT